MTSENANDALKRFLGAQLGAQVLGGNRD